MRISSFSTVFWLSAVNSVHQRCGFIFSNRVCPAYDCKSPVLTQLGTLVKYASSNKFPLRKLIISSRSHSIEDPSSDLLIRERRILIDDRKYLVCEIEKTSQLVDDWIQNQMATVDPFGVVLWPASQVLASRIAADPLSFRGRTVVELGAGTGLCSIVAASSGAAVVATDTNPITLQLLQAAAERQGLSLQTKLFDITGEGCSPPSISIPRPHSSSPASSNPPSLAPMSALPPALALLLPPPSLPFLLLHPAPALPSPSFPMHASYVPSSPAPLRTRHVPCREVT